MTLATVPAQQFSSEQAELIRRTIAKEADDDELAMFFGVCTRTGLDPFARQIFLVPRYSQGKQQMVTQVSVDGQRLVAERTGKYEGQTLEYWCGQDAVWREVWLEPTPPSAAKIGVWKTGCREPIWAVATFAEYAAKDRNGKLGTMWEKMPARMLLKCAEALALRKAFPQELSGVYTVEEMAQADAPQPVIVEASFTPSKPAEDTLEDRLERLMSAVEALPDGPESLANELMGRELQTMSEADKRALYTALRTTLARLKMSAKP